MNVEDQHIIISKEDKPRADWGSKFKSAIAEENPESDLFEALSNAFDENEWTW